MVQLGGYTNAINDLVDDGNGHVSFNIDLNGNLFGFTQTGTVTCPRPVSIVAQERRDGTGGHFDGNVNGGIYTWRAEAPSTQGVHYTIELAF